MRSFLWRGKYFCKVWLYIEENTWKVAINKIVTSRSQWPRSLRHRHVAARLLGFWIQTPLKAWIFINCGCSRDGLLTLPEEPPARVRARARVCMCPNVCDLETTTISQLRPELGCSAAGEKTVFLIFHSITWNCIRHKGFTNIKFM